MTRSLFVGALFGLLGPFAAVAQAEDAPLAATVNGTGIPLAKLDLRLDSFLTQRGVDANHQEAVKASEEFKALRQQMLDVLIAQELLWQEAEKQKLVASSAEVDQALAKVRESLPSEEAYVDRLKQAGYTQESYAVDIKQRLSANRLIEEQIAAGLSVSDKEVHEFYQANPDSFTTPDQVHVRHILVKVDAESDEATKEAAKERIDAVRSKAKKGSDFAELAKEHSEGPTGPKGGDLGFISRGQTVPPFEAAAFELKPGEVSEVVETRFGYHVIKMEERKDGGLIPEAEVSGKVREYLLDKKKQVAVQERVQSLREAGEVEILIPM